MVSVVPVASFPAPTLAAALKSIGLGSWSVLVQYGVDGYRLLYRTISVDGSPTTASGLIVLPRRPARSLRVVEFGHGTQVPRRHGEPDAVMTPAGARMTADQRREMVLQAALIEFAACGLDGGSTRDIARRAGISQPYLFRLFPTKKALFVSLVRRYFQQVVQALATAAVGQAGEDALQAIGSAFGQLCAERTLPLMQVHAYAACTDPEIQAATRAAFEDLRDSVERLTGLPPARVQRWFGTAMLMTAATAMNLHRWWSNRVLLT